MTLVCSAALLLGGCGAMSDTSEKAAATTPSSASASESSEASNDTSTPADTATDTDDAENADSATNTESESTGGDDASDSTADATEASATEADSEAASDQSDQAEPAEGTSKQDCGPIFDGWQAVVGAGSVDCDEAKKVLEEFDKTDGTNPGAPGIAATVAGDWKCSPHFFAKEGTSPREYSMWCERGEDVVLTMAEGTPVPEGTYVDSLKYQNEDSPSFNEVAAFTTPNEEFLCSISNSQSAEARESGRVMCTGDLATDEKVPGAGGDVKPSAISMNSTDEPELFDPTDQQLTKGRALSDGQVMYANGFVCSYRKEQGMKCSSAKHGFEVSPDTLERF